MQIYLSNKGVLCHELRNCAAQLSKVGYSVCICMGTHRDESRSCIFSIPVCSANKGLKIGKSHEYQKGDSVQYKYSVVLRSEVCTSWPLEIVGTNRVNWNIVYYFQILCRPHYSFRSWYAV